MRAAYYRLLSALCDTGTQDGERSLINKLYNHIDRLAAHLFSPTSLQFNIDFENVYPKNVMERGHAAARILTRQFERSNTDTTFARGVFEALKYGAAILKQWPEQVEDGKVEYQKSIVMPWQFSVYREDMNDLSKQSAMCETAMLTLPEVWRRIYHFPDADKLFTRIKTHAQRGDADSEYNSFFHQVLSTSQLQTGIQGATRPIPGGIVQLANNPNQAVMSPQLSVDLVKFHEVWVQGEKDYVTLQIIEPDVLIAPRPDFKLSNLLISGDNHSGVHPYTLIQPNEVQGYFFGRSELTDLMRPQELLSIFTDDAKRLVGLQIDKIIGFVGFDGLTDELYDQQRNAGFVNAPQGTTMTDLTPKFPSELLPFIQFLITTVDQMGGFDNILAGKGEPGVRAGSHAQTLLKTASPRLRDRSLLVERQCAQAADLLLTVMEAKDAHNYWTDGTDLKTIEQSSFKLDDLPEDRRVSVDSHSSSPIFADDHQQLIAFGLQAGIIDGHYAIDNLPYPDKERAHANLRDKEKREAELLQQHPELLEKMVGKGGGHKH
jgi:hypothetical protein